MNLEEQIIPPQKQAPTQCCGNCIFWKQLSEYEGVCTNGLSGTIDTTEVRWKCPRWANLESLGASYEDWDDD